MHSCAPDCPNVQVAAQPPATLSLQQVRCGWKGGWGHALAVAGAGDRKEQSTGKGALQECCRLHCMLTNVRTLCLPA